MMSLKRAWELIRASDKDLMIVAHLPLLDRLLRVLVNPGEDDELPEFGTGTLVRSRRRQQPLADFSAPWAHT